MIVPQENQFDRIHARVNELDLLRFFAALAVVFHHYSLDGFAAESMTIMPYPLLASISKYGYLGVELFFMISGFVILMTASNGDLKKFVISRLIRLYPAFWVCCSITFFHASYWSLGLFCIYPSISYQYDAIKRFYGCAADRRRLLVFICRT